MTIKSTPGPWSIGKGKEKKCGPITMHTVGVFAGEDGKQGNMIANVCSGGDGALKSSLSEVEANARLIASAPKLQESLGILISILKVSWSEAEKQMPEFKEAVAALDESLGNNVY